MKAIERDAAVRALNEAIAAMRLDFEGTPVTNMVDAIGRADRTVRRVRVSYEDALVEDE